MNHRSSEFVMLRIILHNIAYTKINPFLLVPIGVMSLTLLQIPLDGSGSHPTGGV